MSDIVLAQPAAQLGRWVPDNAMIDIVRKSIAPDLSPEHFEVFIHVCKRTGLDPIARQIYGLLRRAKKKVRQGNTWVEQWEERLSIQTAIDGFRLIADRTGLYEGQTEVEWFDGEKWTNYWVGGNPKGARVGVFRKGFREAMYAYARFDSYVAEGHMWGKMPELMIAKCAEALALRKAFPQELSGIYTDDEMAQADAAARSAPSEPAQQSPAARARAAATQAQNTAKKTGWGPDSEPKQPPKELPPGDFVIPGNGKMSGQKVSSLSIEQLELGMKSPFVPLANACKAVYDQRMEEGEKNKPAADPTEEPTQVGPIPANDFSEYT